MLALLAGCDSTALGTPRPCHWTINGVSGEGGCTVLEAMEPATLRLMAGRLAVNAPPFHDVDGGYHGIAEYDGVDPACHAPAVVHVEVTASTWLARVDESACYPPLVAEVSGER